MIQVNKKKALLLFFMLFLTTIIFAQDRTTLSLPLLKENSQIDSLLDIAISQGKAGNFYFELTILDVNYMPNTVEQYYSILQHRYENGNIHCSLPISDYIKEAGYFQYKGYTIIVFRKNDNGHLLKKAHGFRLFNFVFVPEIEGLPINRKGLYNESFDYYKGKFSLHNSARIE